MIKVFCQPCTVHPPISSCIIIIPAMHSIPLERKYTKAQIKCPRAQKTIGWTCFEISTGLTTGHY
jgi:hypothetical protein